MKKQSSSPVHSSPTVQQITELLKGGHAHVPFTAAVENLSVKLVGVKPPKLPYSIWQLVEHIRIAQDDIVRFSQSADYTSPKWPDDYWPRDTAPAHASDWEKSLAAIARDLETFLGLISDPGADLFKPFPYGQGQNLFREALLIADHTSYHTGEILVIRRLLDSW